jgi:endonuclease/exonuclease/phosphatase family metal-dependent hydrolase
VNRRRALPFPAGSVRSLAGLAVMISIALSAPAVGAAEPKGPRFKVMTRNLYLGADLTPAIAATTIPQLAVAGTRIWRTVEATDFPARARVLAAEIADADPDLIAVQEAAIWRVGPPDGPPVLGGTPATQVVYDFLASLLDELRRARAEYVVVESQDEADLEGITTLGFDIRLTQRDVILAKKAKVDAGEIAWTTAQGASFPPAIQLTLPLVGGLATVESTRGYVFADVTVNKQSFRFIATHLEAFSAGRRAQQAAFLAAFVAAGAPVVILAGDLNSDPRDATTAPPDPTANNLAFLLLTGTFGFSDTWVAANGPLAPGNTSGFNELVNDRDTSGLTKRIDHVLARPEVEAVRSVVTGTDGDDRTPAGLWPSDHAGVTATLRLP